MGMTGEQAYVLAKKLIEAGGGGGGTVDAYTKTQTDNLLMQKVDKETGKGLFSGSYKDLKDAPTIPSKTSELQNDSGYLTEHQDLTDYAKKTDIPTTVAELTDSSSYAKKTDIPMTLPANGGNSNTVNNHTVKSDVPENAVFTDTIYDDTEVKKSIEELNSNLHNLEFGTINHNIPRLVPKDITSYYTDGTLWDRLEGTNGFSLFEDIFVGDYIKMSRAISAYEQTQQYQTTGSQYVTIAGIDTLWGNGDNTSILYHHLVMIPGMGFDGTQHFGRSRMNPTNSTEGGYVGSEMHTTTIGAIATSGSTATTATINQQLYAEFGSHLKTTREALSNSLNSTGYNRFGSNTGCSNNLAWTDCQAVLMSEIEVFGSTVWSSSGYDTGTAKAHLPLFANSICAINNRSAYYFLKDVASASYFCYCNSYGTASYNNATSAGYYVRPRFVIAK